MDRRSFLRAALALPVVALFAPLLPKPVVRAALPLPLIVDPYVPFDVVYLIDFQRLWNQKLVSWESVLRAYGIRS